MSGHCPITVEVEADALKVDIIENKTEIYPPPTFEVEQISFYGRWKKFIANTMANMVCGVTNRPYFMFTGRPTTQIVYITSDDYLPV